MSSSKNMLTVPIVRFVKCPKCLKILTEFAEIPVYVCGGCGAILQAKARSSSGKNSSTVSANPDCQNLPDIDPLSNGSASPAQDTPASDALRALEQVVLKNLNVSDSNDQTIFKESFRHEQRGISKLEVSDWDSETCEDKWEPSGLEGTRAQDHMIDREHPIEGNRAVNEEREISLSVKQEANDSFKSSNKLEGFSESMEHGAISEDDMIHMELGNGNNFRMNTGSSPAYDGSVSSTDEDRLGHIPRKYLLYSRRTFRNKNVSYSFDSAKVEQNFMRMPSNERLASASSGDLSMGHVQPIEEEASFASRDFQQNSSEMENDGSSSSPKRETELEAKFTFPEKEDNEQILRKVDELKKELRRLLKNAAYHKGSSLFDIKAMHFLGKVPPKECRSSLIAFPMHPNSSNQQCNLVTSCCHNGHCMPCPHNVCCHLPEATTQPLNVESDPPAFQNPKNMQFKDFKPQTIMWHCRPVSGGAPFAICSKCFKLLQLPADFLVFPRRVHKLRCGACSQVLMYYFRPRPHSMIQTSPVAQHQPSKESECDEVAIDETLAQSKELTCWDPTSVSGEYSTKNNSSNVESSLHTSRSSDGILEEQSGSKQLNSLPLHNLMGYASASELLFHTNYSGDGYQSTELASNFYRTAERRI